VDVERGSTTGTLIASPKVLAIGALLADVAVVALPLSDGESQLSSVVSGAIPFRAKAAYLLLLFAFAVAIVVGIVVERRGHPAVASGVFFGLLVVLALRVVASVLTTIGGWSWQATVVLGLQTIECVLLALAARGAGRVAT
jgi:hypothetical protein